MSLSGKFTNIDNNGATSSYLINVDLDSASGVAHSALTTSYHYSPDYPLSLAQSSVDNELINHSLGGYWYDNKEVPTLLTVDVSSIFSGKTESVVYAHKQTVYPKVDSNLLPIATRYITSEGYYFVERPPFQVDIDLYVTKNRYSDNRRKMNPYKIWIPWTLTIFNPNDLSDVKIMFSHKPLSSMEDVYSPSFLPNAYMDGRICFASSLSDISVENIDKKDIRYIYSMIFNEYMNGGWNLDLTPNVLRFFQYVPSFENFPALCKFLSPDKVLLRKTYPKMTTRQLENFNFSTASRSTLSVFNYFFTQLSMLSLEETLEFYKEISEFPTNSRYGKCTYTFQDFLDTIKKNPKTAFVASYENFSSTVQDILIQNSNLDESFFLYQSFPVIVYNIDSTNLNSSFRLKYYFDLSSLHEILEHYVNNTSKNIVYLLDYATKQFSIVDIQNTISNDYYDFIKTKIGAPYSSFNSYHTFRNHLLQKTSYTSLESNAQESFV
jgi:hypothetical protein